MDVETPRTPASQAPKTTSRNVLTFSRFYSLVNRISIKTHLKNKKKAYPSDEKKTKQNKACVDSLHSEYRTVHCPKKALHLELERERERERRATGGLTCVFRRFMKEFIAKKKETVTSQKLKLNVS